jgi:phage terminase Nu1 subunit (DNA packaging protein)
MLRKAKAAGCPAFDSAGRIKLGVLLRWFFSQSADTEAEQPPDGLATWRDALNRVQTKREEIRLAKDRGQVVEFDEARRQASEAAALYFAELDRMCRELPPVLKGLGEVAIFEKLESRREEIRAQLNAAFAAVGKSE